jgi:toxin-antitoxin system PIN domain toxin
LSIYLLDVNLLLALTDPMHIHHDIAHGWFEVTGAAGWATCPLTENGFVRVASHPQYPNRPGDAGTVLGILRRFCAAGGHHFWPADISIRDVIESGQIVTHARITDIYLLGLAVHRDAKLATLDTRIPARAIAGGADALELISA